MTNEMTAEEAVEILKYERDNDIFVATEYREKLHEALTKAIKALEQQPSEDCISRQAVIDFIIDNYGVGFNSLTNGIRDYLPSVTPRRDLAETSQDCISRQAVIRLVEQYPNIIGNRCSGLISDIKHLPSVKPQTVTEFADKCKECGKIQNEFFNFDAPMVKNSEAVSSKMCEYCEHATPLVTDKSGDKGISLMYPNTLSAYGYDINGANSNGICAKIHYCPMCGRELEDRE